MLYNTKQANKQKNSNAKGHISVQLSGLHYSDFMPMLDVVYNALQTNTLNTVLLLLHLSVFLQPALFA